MGKLGSSRGDGDIDGDIWALGRERALFPQSGKHIPAPPNDLQAFFLFILRFAMARLSGLQRDVLSLYRKCLREIRNKPEVGYITSSHVNLS